MKIRNIRHKGLRSLVEKNSAKGLQADYVAKITDIMIFLIEIDDVSEVFDLHKYKPHLLSGDRAGVYSLHVTKNWRITFKHDADENELYDLDYEDYH
ncbi:MAG: type II toxin-antitoxin system RelE/ParE family toxin [Pseudomonadota bacterium]